VRRCDAAKNKTTGMSASRHEAQRRRCPWKILWLSFAAFMQMKIGRGLPLVH